MDSWVDGPVNRHEEGEWIYLDEKCCRLQRGSVAKFARRTVIGRLARRF